MLSTEAYTPSASGALWICIDVPGSQGRTVGQNANTGSQTFSKQQVTVHPSQNKEGEAAQATWGIYKATVNNNAGKLYSLFN